MFKRSQREIKKRPKGKNRLYQSVTLFIFCLSGLFVYYGLTQYLFKKASFISPIPVVANNKSLQLNSNTSKIDSLATLVKKNNIAFIDISLSSDKYITVTLATGEEILFSQEKNLEPQISSLQLIVSRLTIEGKRFSRLDFRFDEPVIALK